MEIGYFIPHLPIPTHDEPTSKQPHHALRHEGSRAARTASAPWRTVLDRDRQIGSITPLGMHGGAPEHSYGTLQLSWRTSTSHQARRLAARYARRIRSPIATRTLHALARCTRRRHTTLVRTDAAARSADAVRDEPTRNCIHTTDTTDSTTACIPWHTRCTTECTVTTVPTVLYTACTTDTASAHIPP